MSAWYRWERFAAGPKQPPPAHGIKLKKAGTTWWGKRWIEALETVLRGDAGRLGRGRTYARAGRAHDLAVKDGKVTAKVTGSRPKPYAITITLRQLGDAAWKKAVDGMAAKAQFTAELLAGQMPQDIDDVFRAAGTSLFPQQRADLVTSCSCPDWGDPCKHVAATHYILGEALDRDPFLLFELRGRTKEQVLGALRAARSGEPATPGEASRAGSKAKRKGARAAAAAAPPSLEASEPEVPAVKLGKLKVAEYDRPREALPALAFTFDAPAAPDAVLRQLGAPAGWSAPRTPAELLAPLVHAAAETARRIALSDPEAPSSERPAASTGTPPRRHRTR